MDRPFQHDLRATQTSNHITIQPSRRNQEPQWNTQAARPKPLSRPNDKTRLKTKSETHHRPTGGFRLTHTASLSASTVATRRFHASKRTMPEWKDWSVGDVGNADVQDWIQKMADGGAGSATIEKAVGVLRGALRIAVTARLVPANVALDLAIAATGHPHSRFEGRSGLSGGRYRTRTDDLFRVNKDRAILGCPVWSALVRTCP